MRGKASRCPSATGAVHETSLWRSGMPQKGLQICQQPALTLAPSAAVLSYIRELSVPPPPPSPYISLTFSAAMGNDGGSIPDRRDLVKSKPKVRSTAAVHQAFD